MEWRGVTERIRSFTSAQPNTHTTACLVASADHVIKIHVVCLHQTRQGRSQIQIFLNNSYFHPILQFQQMNNSLKLLKLEDKIYKGDIPYQSGIQILPNQNN
jgi:hypothetical protein